jgi:hypothetical protein
MSSKAKSISQDSPFKLALTAEKYTFCVIKAFELLKNVKTGRAPYLGLEWIMHAIKKPNPSRGTFPLKPNLQKRVLALKNMWFEWLGFIFDTYRIP